jgi:hypothetical protein
MMMMMMMMMMCEKKFLLYFSRCRRKKVMRDVLFSRDSLLFLVFLFLFLFSSVSFCFFLGLRVVFFLRSHSNQHITLESCNSYSYISLFFLTSRFGDDDDDDDEEDETTRAFVRTVSNSLLLLLLLLLGKRVALRRAFYPLTLLVLPRK